MTLDPEPTGTTEDPTGTTAQAADGSGAPAADGSGGGETEAQELERLRRLHEQDLSRLSAAEDATRAVQQLSQQVAELQARQAATTPPMAMPNAGASEAAQMQQLTMRLALGDPSLTQDERDRATAMTLYRQEQLAQMTQRQVRDASEMSQIPVTDHSDTLKQYQTGLYASPLAAYNGVLAERYRKDAKSRDEKAASDQREREARARGTVASAPATAAPASAIAIANGTIKRQDYLTACTNAERGDPAARKVLAQYDSGKLRILD